MKEITGNLWDYEGRGIIVVTTNGVLNKCGELVMGKGIALQAYGRDIRLAKIFGDHVKERGNVPLLFENWLSFPTKENWRDKSIPSLIKRSAEFAQKISDENPHLSFYSSRPGCGNGGLEWEDVRPIIYPILSDKFTIVSP